MRSEIEYNSDWIRLLQYEMRYAPVVVQQTYARFLENIFKLFTEYFSKLQEQQVVRKDVPPESIARAFHSLAFGFYHIESVLGNPTDIVENRRKMINDFVMIFHAGTYRTISLTKAG